MAYGRMTEEEVAELEKENALYRKQIDAQAAARELERKAAADATAGSREWPANVAPGSWHTEAAGYDPMKDKGFMARSVSEREMLTKRFNQDQRDSRDLALAETAMRGEVAKGEAAANIAGIKATSLIDAARARGQSALDVQALRNEQQAANNQMKKDIAADRTAAQREIAAGRNQTQIAIAEKNAAARFDVAKLNQMNANERAAAVLEMRKDVEKMRQSGADRREMVSSLMGVLKGAATFGTVDQTVKQLGEIGFTAEEIKEAMKSIGGGKTEGAGRSPAIRTEDEGKTLSGGVARWDRRRDGRFDPFRV